MDNADVTVAVAVTVTKPVGETGVTESKPTEMTDAEIVRAAAVLSKYIDIPTFTEPPHHLEYETTMKSFVFDSNGRRIR